MQILTVDAINTQINKNKYLIDVLFLVLKSKHKLLIRIHFVYYLF